MLTRTEAWSYLEMGKTFRLWWGFLNCLFLYLVVFESQ